MGKSVPSSLKALGRKALPERIEAGGQVYMHAQTFKHDFFAVTALYEGEAGKVLLKIQREASFLGLPLRFVGRFLNRREVGAFRRLEDIDGVPELIDTFGSTGMVRAFVEGHPLKKGERVPDDFHARLRTLVDQIHARNMAYVDLEKCENVLCGQDGKPYLFDFQISWYLPKKWGGELWPARWLRRRFQRGDLYHLVKLQRRTRPDQLTEEALAASYRKPWYVRVHGFVARPLTLVRRAILSRVDPRRKDGERGRVAQDDLTGAS